LVAFPAIRLRQKIQWSCRARVEAGGFLKFGYRRIDLVAVEEQLAQVCACVPEVRIQANRLLESRQSFIATNCSRCGPGAKQSLGKPILGDVTLGVLPCSVAKSGDGFIEVPFLHRNQPQGDDGKYFLRSLV